MNLKGKILRWMLNVKIVNLLTFTHTNTHTHTHTHTHTVSLCLLCEDCIVTLVKIALHSDSHHGN